MNQSINPDNNISFVFLFFMFSILAEVNLDILPSPGESHRTRFCSPARSSAPEVLKEHNIM